MVLHLHLLNDYRKFVALILYLDLKKGFNLQTLETEFIHQGEFNYYLQINTPSMYKASNILVNPDFFNSANFFNKKILLGVLTQNLNLNKQNR